MSIKYRAGAFELKDLDEKTGVFTGYASVFGNMDSYRDVIERGAFAKTLSEHGHRVKVLWQHDPYTPIGKPKVMKEDDRGLYVEAQVSQTTQGKDALILLADGVVNELSIGYSPIKHQWDAEGKIRRLMEVKLWEFSPVTWAANDLAIITGTKSLEEDLPALLMQLKGAAAEAQAGKVISEKNRHLVTSAVDALKGSIDALQALLVAIEPGDGKTDPTTQQPPEPPKGMTDPGLSALLAEMKSFAGAPDPGIQSVMNILAEFKQYGRSA